MRPQDADAIEEVVNRRVEKEMEKRHGHEYMKDENIAELFDEIDQIRGE